MAIELLRCPENPIVTAGEPAWRRAVSFNPGAIYHNGKFFLYERTAAQLRPFHCTIGMLESEDGIHFKLSRDEPVVTPEMCGSVYGSVQDPRIIPIEDRFYMSFAFRPYAWASHPTGVGVPDSYQVDYPGFSGNDTENQTRSGLAVSDDLYNWEFHSWVTPPDLDDRNVIPFPEKIGGRYATLRRPSPFVGTQANHAEQPCVKLSWSDDLRNWSDPETVLEPKFAWEDNRVGGSTPPIKTDKGWLILYHAVQNVVPEIRSVVYRVSAAMLDLENPTKVIARCPEPILEPREYYEKFGTYIPNVVFPTGIVPRGDDLYIYYGVCDTAIALATCSLRELLDHVMQFPE